MKKLLFLLLSTSYLLPTTPAYAVCPVCTVAVAGGLGLSRYFGIDDTISGLWVGGLILSSSFWLSDWLKKKKENWNKQTILIVSVVFLYAFTLIPLQMTDVIGHPFNKIFGVDKLLFGIAIGSLIFILAVHFDKLARKMAGKQFFPYQKVVFPVASLAIMSAVTFFTLKYLRI